MHLMTMLVSCSVLFLQSWDSGAASKPQMRSGRGRKASRPRLVPVARDSGRVDADTSSKRLPSPSRMGLSFEQLMAQAGEYDQPLLSPDALPSMVGP